MKIIPETYDIIIIGGGPVGLFGAYYAGLRDMKVKLLDRRHELGGQLTAIYPEKWVYDIPGIPAIRGKQLFQNLTQQIAPYNTPIGVNEEVVKVTKNRNNILRMESSNGNIHHAKTIMLCLGMGAHIPRRLPIANLEEFEGRGICYGVHNLNEYKDKKVLVVGGGDSALDLALTVQEVAQDVSLIHRSDRFNAHEETTKKLYASNVEIRVHHELASISGTDQLLKKAVLNDLQTQQKTEIEVDKIIIAIGLIFNLQGLKDWGLDMENNAIVVDHNRQTSIPGVFAAGDIVTYPGKMRLIGTGAAEAMQGINEAKRYITENFPFL